MLIGPHTHDEFMEVARNFHGYPAPGLIIGGYMVELARRGLPEGVLFDAISETEQCLPDAVQLLTPCTVGNGWLRIMNFGIYAVSLFDKRTGEGVRVHLDVDKMGPWGEIRTWFLKLKPKKDQDTPLLQAQIKEAGPDILTARPITVRPDRLGHKGKGLVGRCPLCGEYYPVASGGICRSCQGESPYHTGPGFAFEGQPALRAVPVAEAVGKRALHDMTRIVPGEHKDAEFTAGQELTAGDICRLQMMGRNSIYVQDAADSDNDWVHEDEAAKTFAAMLAGEGVAMREDPREGKANLVATRDGLLMVDTERLERFNLVPDVMCATRQGYSMVLTGAKVAGTRAIPLYLSRENFIKATAMLQDGPILQVLPMRAARIGILVTGTEVFQGLIQDKFAPIITQKAQRLNCEVVKTVFAPDDAALITQGVRDLIAAGADLVVTTAGLSVDPDDVTRKGLIDAGLTDMLYGLPMLPGTMSLVGRIASEQAPHPVQVVGVPACALFFKTTALDILLPRLLAGVEITRRDLAKLGDGGLCMECKSCTYPKCPFGK